jgi:hypothetical protein
MPLLEGVRYAYRASQSSGAHADSQGLRLTARDALDTIPCKTLPFTSTYRHLEVDKVHKYYLDVNVMVGYPEDRANLCLFGFTPGAWRKQSRWGLMELTSTEER